MHDKVCTSMLLRPGLTLRCNVQHIFMNGFNAQASNSQLSLSSLGLWRFGRNFMASCKLSLQSLQQSLYRVYTVKLCAAALHVYAFGTFKFGIPPCTDK